MEASATAKGDSGNFASKAHDMIEWTTVEHPHIASWTSKGDTFFVYNSSELERLCLPRYFCHSNYKTFQRQLSMYGFRNVTKEATTSIAPGRGGNGAHTKKFTVYQHQHFIRGRPDLIAQISRSKSGDHTQRRSRQDEALKGVSDELHLLHLKVDEVMRKQNPAPNQGAPNELGKRLDRVEGEIQSLHGKLDLVIAMLSESSDAQSRLSSSSASQSQSPRQRQKVRPLQPARTISDHSRDKEDGVHRESTVAAGRKRARHGNEQPFAMDGAEGKKYVSSEESSSSLDSSDEEEAASMTFSSLGDFDLDDLDLALRTSSEGSNSKLDSDKETVCQRNQSQQQVVANEGKSSGCGGHTHAFYDVQTLEKCGSPLDEDDDFCDLLDMDLRTSPPSIPSEEEGGEGNLAKLALPGPLGGISDDKMDIEPLPLTKGALEIPVDTFRDNPVGAPAVQRGAAANSDGGRPDGHPPRGMRKFVGRHRAALIAGAMPSMVMALSLGTALSVGPQHPMLRGSLTSSATPTPTRSRTKIAAKGSLSSSGCSNPFHDIESFESYCGPLSDTESDSFDLDFQEEGGRLRAAPIGPSYPLRDLDVGIEPTSMTQPFM